MTCRGILQILEMAEAIDWQQYDEPDDWHQDEGFPPEEWAW